MSENDYLKGWSIPDLDAEYDRTMEKVENVLQEIDNLKSLKRGLINRCKFIDKVIDSR